MMNTGKMRSVRSINGGVLRWVGVMAPMAAQSKHWLDALVGALITTPVCWTRNRAFCVLRRRRGPSPKSVASKPGAANGRET